MRAASASEIPPLVLSIVVVYKDSSNLVSTPKSCLLAENWSHCPPDFFPHAAAAFFAPIPASSSSVIPLVPSLSSGAHATSSRSCPVAPLEMPPSVKSSFIRLGPTAKSLIPTSLAAMLAISSIAIAIVSIGLLLCARSFAPASRFVHPYLIVASPPFFVVSANTPSIVSPVVFVTSTTCPRAIFSANAIRSPSFGAIARSRVASRLRAVDSSPNRRSRLHARRASRRVASRARSRGAIDASPRSRRARVFARARSTPRDAR